MRCDRYSWVSKLFFFFTCLCIANLVFAADEIVNVPDLAFSPTEGDVSMVYLNAIFGQVGNLLHGTGSQIMGQIFAVLNSGVAVIGGVILLYTLVLTTLNTANEGQFLGQKLSSVWVPARTLAGSALLLPQTSGYSTIQVFVMWLVVQGVGLADNIWAQALTFLQKGGVIVNMSQKPVPNRSSDSLDNVSKLFRSQVCLQGLQNRLQAAREAALVDGSVSIPSPVPDLFSTIDVLNPAVNDPQSAVLTVPIPNLKGVFAPGSPEVNAYGAFDGACGSITLTKTPGAASAVGSDNLFYRNSTGQLISLRVMAVHQLLSDFNAPAGQAVSWLALPPDVRIPKDMGQCPSGAKVCDNKNWNNGLPALLPGTILQNGFADYQGIMQPAFRNHEKSQQWIDQAKKKGWILAGSYYLNLAQLNENLKLNLDKMEGVTFGDPLSPEKFCAHQSPFTNLGESSTGVKNCNLLRGWIYEAPMSTYIQSAIHYLMIDAVCADPQHPFAPQNPNCNPAKGAGGKTGVSGLAARLLDIVTGGLFTVGHQMEELRNAHLNGKNPLLILTNLGSTLIDVVTRIWLVGTLLLVVIAIATGSVPSESISSAPMVMVMWFIPFLTFLMTLAFSSGVFLLYYIPAIPFIIFSFAAVGWMIGVVESMVAAPIVALGMMHPEGHEAFGRADNALMLLFNVFLRPGMMVIGLFAGFILSYVGVWLLGAGFFGVQHVIHHYNTGSAFLWYPLCMAMLYTYFAVQVVSQAFGLIHLLPDKVLRWLSGGAQESLGGEMAGQTMQSVSRATGQTGMQAGRVMPDSGTSLSSRARWDKDAIKDSAPFKKKQVDIGLQEQPTASGASNTEAEQKAGGEDGAPGAGDDARSNDDGAPLASSASPDHPGGVPSAPPSSPSATPPPSPTDGQGESSVASVPNDSSKEPGDSEDNESDDDKKDDDKK